MKSPGHLQADDMAIAVALDHPAGEAFDQDRAARALGAPPDDQLVAGKLFLVLDQVFDELLFILAHRPAQAAEQEPPGARISLQFRGADLWPIRSFHAC